MKIKGIIFDLDGTLLDSSYVWSAAGPNYVKMKGFEPEPDLCDKIYGRSLLQAAQFLKQYYHLPESEETIMNDINKIVEQEYLHHIKEKEGVRTLLSELSKRNVPMCVATLTDRYLVEAVFKRLGILDYFQDIITATEVGSGKDKPDIYYKAANSLGTKVEETLVAEDMVYTATTAKNGGFVVAGVYDKDAEDKQEALKKVVDVYIKDWNDFDYSILA